MKINKYIITLLIALIMRLPRLPDAEQKPTDNPDLTESQTTGTSPATTVQNDNDLSKLQKTILDNKEAVGIAYIGYVGHEANEKEVLNFVKNSQYADKYDFLCETPLVNAGGAELYAVVIADVKYSASVYRAEITDNGEYSVKTDNALYNYSGNGIIFLPRCNESKIHSNVSLYFKKRKRLFFGIPDAVRNGRTSCRGKIL